MSLWILARLLHNHQYFWSNEHILDSILVDCVLIIINAIIVLNCLRVELHQLCNCVQCEATLVYFQFKVEYLLGEVHWQLLVLDSEARSSGALRAVGTSAISTALLIAAYRGLAAAWWSEIGGCCGGGPTLISRCSLTLRFVHAEQFVDIMVICTLYDDLLVFLVLGGVWHSGSPDGLPHHVNLPGSTLALFHMTTRITVSSQIHLITIVLLLLIFGRKCSCRCSGAYDFDFIIICFAKCPIPRHVFDIVFVLVFFCFPAE